MASHDFRERALAEAGRYGPDRWVFVRELLQNARDAGARRVVFTVGEAEGVARIVCRDDGDGMSFEEARRYLFTLYASSKEEGRGLAGKFGVGFWSVLRFEPSRIVIRSRPVGGEAWQVELQGSLDDARAEPSDLAGGTEIVLERRGVDGELARRVLDAVHQNGRYLRQRDRPSELLEILVDGDRVNEPFGLPPPCTAFRRGGARGVVSLGQAARVELFSRGLRVRSATTLEDLLSEARHTSRARVSFPELPGGVAPVVLLESDDLEVLLSRTEAREDRALERLVDLAQRELDRLVERQLACVRPEAFWRRWADGARRTWREVMPRGAAGVALAAAAGLALLGGGWALSRMLPRAPSGVELAAASARTPASLPAPLAVAPYEDLAPHYRGPQADVLPPLQRRVDLAYEPADQQVYYRALAVNGVRPDPRRTAVEHISYPGRRCETECLTTTIRFEAKTERVRLPMPTGHVLDSTSVRVDGRPVAVYTSALGEPQVLRDEAQSGVLSYRTGPGVPLSSNPAPVPHPLPRDAVRTVERVRDLPFSERVVELTRFVRERVQYRTDEVTARHHLDERHAGMDLVTRALAIGAGDCDIVNGVLTVLLQSAGDDARLAVGYVGAEGRALPGLHAWVEVREPGSPWQVLDATQSPDTGGAGVAPPVGSLPAAAPPATDRLPLLAADVPREAAAVTVPPGMQNRVGAGLLGAGLVLLLLPAGVAFARRTRRRTVVDESHDVARLLRGALERPEAFAHVPSLYQRPLVSTLGGRNISIAEARRLASRGHLFCTHAGSDLARRAARRGAAVLDTADAAARVLAEAFAAVSLDRWNAWLEESASSPLFADLDRWIRSYGERWSVRCVEGLGPIAQVLELPRRGIFPWDPSLRRVVLVDASAGWVERLAAMQASRPAEARFCALDRLLEDLDLPRARAEVLLARSAREALLERVR